jgi:hypothetical protein
LQRWRATVFVVGVLELSAAFCTPVVTPFLCAEVREKLVTRFRRTQEQADELVFTTHFSFAP